MVKNKYNDDLIIELRQSGLSWVDVADELDVTEAALRSYSRRSDWYDIVKDTYIKANMHDFSEPVDAIGPVDSTNTVNNNVGTVQLYEDRKTGNTTANVVFHFTNEDDVPTNLSDEDMLRMHNLDPNKFVITSVKSNVYTTPKGGGELYYNFQSKITAKPKAVGETRESVLDVLSKAVIPHNVEVINNGLTNIVIPLADLHFGVTKMSDPVVRKKLDGIVDIIRRGFNKIVIEQLGDLFHSSQMRSSQTMRGTILEDVDTVQAVEDAKTFYHAIISEALENGNEVIIEHAYGNHSGNMEYMFLNYLEVKYPDATINYHNDPRHVYMLDNVAIMISHGNLAKGKLNSIFTTNYKKEWAASESAEIHTGHFHTQEKDIDGIILRQMGTVKPNDTYEIENGWTMGKKIIQVIEYNKDRSIAIYEV